MKKSNLKISDSKDLNSGLLFALVTVENEIKVCMLINNHLDIELKLGEDIHIQDKSGTRIFRKYEYEDDEGVEKYTLIVNRSSGTVLFRELKQVDFLFIIKSESNQQALENAVFKLRNKNTFTVINKLNPSLIHKYRNIGDYT